MKKSEIIFHLLGVDKKVPLTEKEMAESLTVTFYPQHQQNKRLNQFTTLLKKIFIQIGVTVLPYRETLTENEGKVKPGVVIIEQGMGQDEDLAIKKVSSLYHNPIVAIFDSPPPIPENPSLQETLDSIVGVLAWNLVHVPVFIEKNKWTICTMNGAVIECDNPESPLRDVLYSLVPKLSAQVVPPKREEIVYRDGMPGAEERGYKAFVNDFMSAAKVWRDNGLMLAHTSISDLEYRNRFYKRIVSRYLDHRTGMSYGFMVKQLPVPVEPAIEYDSAPNGLKKKLLNQHIVKDKSGLFYARINLFEKDWIAKIPDVWLLSTRSGCNKTNLNPQKDILRLGLHKGEITIDTPPKSSHEACRPSYDTYAILAHAVGNIITAGILRARDKNAVLPELLETNGLSISHWHGYPDKEFALPGYVIHGEDNPPVSCSTPQSAAYAFNGKFRAVQEMQDSIHNYRGDIHVEPHHGTNISGGMTLTETASWTDKMHKQRASAAVSSL